MLTVQFLNKVVDMVVYDSCPWSRQCRAVAFTDKVVDIPVLEQWKCLRFSHRQSLMTIWSGEGFFGAFCAIFALLRVSRS